MKRKQLLALSFLISAGALARSPVPLMPPRLASINEDTTAIAQIEPGGSRHAIGFGVELGLTGRRAATAGDVLGMEVFWGGRVFARLPVWDELYLKPSIGYFRKSSGAGDASVTQQTLEGGLVVEYAFLHISRFRWLAGVAQRLELASSSINVMGTSDGSSGLRYRAGPSTGIAYGISSDISFVADADVTFPFTQPVRTYTAVSAGFVYYLP